MALEVLKWLRSQDPPYPWGEGFEGFDTCTRAAKRGHLEVLEWLRGQDPPRPWNTSACIRAAGDPEVLAWLHFHNAKE